ncbi:MAG: hypothetical protein D6730_07840 [Bacteroidetes bacterium]|nr:MAG: hypothetical protein D6730_07840 [Bacteroidota bacterium]
MGLLAQLFPQLGAQRAGISSLTFLKMDVSPRSAALASANLCLPGDLYSAYTNPATMPEVSGFGLAASNTFWVADINYAFLSATIPTGAGHFAASLSALGSGPMKVRTVFQPEGTGEYFYANYYTAGLTYSQQLTDQFSYGITAKYVHEQLAEFRANTAVFDLGFLYRTDVKELRFAVLVQSFGFNSVLHGELEQEDALLQKTPDLESYPAPTIFKLGISMVPYRNESGDQSLLAAVQLNHPNDNAENIRLALEYNYKSLLFLRAGYKINVKDQDYPTAGVGLRMRMGRHPLMFDYAFDPMRFLGVVHRVGLSFEVNSKER